MNDVLGRSDAPADVDDRVLTTDELSKVRAYQVVDSRRLVCVLLRDRLQLTRQILRRRITKLARLRRELTEYRMNTH